MKTISSNLSTKVIVSRILLTISITVLAYFGLKTGIHGLRYFLNYPANENRPALSLLPHIATGFLALMLGPWQFWKELRNRYRHLHRVMGKIYLLAVAISSSSALYMAIMSERFVFKAGLITFSLVWMVTGLLAYLTIRKGLIKEHQQWMIRNYVTTFGFVTFRVGMGEFLQAGFPFEEVAAMMAWLAWVPSLLISELFIQLSQSKLLAKKGFAAVGQTA